MVPRSHFPDGPDGSAHGQRLQQRRDAPDERGRQSHCSHVTRLRDVLGKNTTSTYFNLITTEYRAHCTIFRETCTVIILIAYLQGPKSPNGFGILDLRRNGLSEQRFQFPFAGFDVTRVLNRNFRMCYRKSNSRGNTTPMYL